MSLNWLEVVPKDTARRTRRYTHPFYPDKKLGQHRTVGGKGKVARLTRRQKDKGEVVSIREAR